MRFLMFLALLAMVGGLALACGGGGGDDDDDDTAADDDTDTDDDDDDDDSDGDDDSGDDDTGGDDDLTDTDIDDLPLPAGVFEVFAKDDLQGFLDIGLDLHAGEDAMDVEKNFLMDALEIIHNDADSEKADFPDVYLRFRNQSEDSSIRADYQSDPPGAEGVFDLVGLITAKADCFSVFLDAEIVEDGCTYRLPTVFSACVNLVGLTSFQWADIVRDKTPPDSSPDSPCKAIAPEGSRRLLEETDEVVDFSPTFGPE